jgi:hypothetical protein
VEIVVFDEEAAARVVAELAATTDARLVVDIRTAMEDVAAVWQSWRGDPAHGRTDQPDGAGGDDLDAVVMHALRAIRALGPDDDLRGATRAVAGVLDVAWPRERPGERAMADAVAALRYWSVSRPRSVREARALR